MLIENDLLIPLKHLHRQNQATPGACMEIFQNCELNAVRLGVIVLLAHKDGIRFGRGIQHRLPADFLARRGLDDSKIGFTRHRHGWNEHNTSKS